MWCLIAAVLAGVCANGDSITATCGNNGNYTITGEW